MKIIQRCFIVLFILLLSVPALAQKNSLVGKWTIVSLDVLGMTINLEKPAESKLKIASHIEKEKGSKPDSVVVENAYAEMKSMFAGTIVEFTSSGKGIYYVTLPSGEIKIDSATYVVDYDKGILTTISFEEGQQINVITKIKFEGEYLTLIKGEQQELVVFKRSK